MLVCEFRDNQRVGVGVDVQVIEDGEILVSTSCIDADMARYVAERFKRDHLRTGWSEPSNASLLVRKGGFEPPRYCYRQPLKLVRLPVPPLPLMRGTTSGRVPVYFGGV